MSFSLQCLCEHSHSFMNIGHGPQLQLQHQREKQLFHLPLFPLWHFTKSDDASDVRSLTLVGLPDSSWAFVQLLEYENVWAWHSHWERLSVTGMLVSSINWTVLILCLDICTTYFPVQKKCICVKTNNSKCENKYYISSETKLDVYKYSKFTTGKCDFIQ